jgi:monoamine oxidase
VSSRDVQSNDRANGSRDQFAYRAIADRRLNITRSADRPDRRCVSIHIMAAPARTSILIAGAGLAGLTAAVDLHEVGYRVTVLDARDRVGGRVHTIRNAFRHEQSGEAGGDMIDERQVEILRLIDRFRLRAVPILRGGFTFFRRGPDGRVRRARRAWADIEKALRPLIRDFNLGEQRWNTAIAQRLARTSLAQWLDDIGAGDELRAPVQAMRGFFLADASELSLLALVDQFATGDDPTRRFRIAGGNDRLPRAMANALGDRVRLRHVVGRVRQHERGVTVAIELPEGRTEQLSADYAILTLPATHVRDLAFDPPLPDLQREAFASLRYGATTKLLAQFDRRFWRTPTRTRGFGTDSLFGGIWEANEEQTGRPGILAMVAGGSASREAKRRIATRDPGWLREELAWLAARRAQVLATHATTWEDDPWARGGYAVFHAGFNPELRTWLAKPFGRILFAGEHTHLKWQGYMEGAVQSGLRAAAEVRALSNHL